MTQSIGCHIAHDSSSYEIEIGMGVWTCQALFLSNIASNIAIIADETTGLLFGKKLQKQLLSSGLNVQLFTFPPGEVNKTRKTKEILEDQLLDQGFGRDSCIVALGGGITIDLAGFVAATYCRGIPIVMMPTSLLAMVDASIGGKSGVNVSQGKNLVGAIHQPSKVVIELSFLQTLPQKELANGIVEMIKHGVIASYDHFAQLEKFGPNFGKDAATVSSLIAQSCLIKKEIIEADEKESGKRRLLNFGHTVGHALELLSGYSLSHGEAVAIGMLAESHLAVQRQLLAPAALDRIKNLLNLCGLNLQLPQRFDVDRIIEAMSFDKKSLKKNPRFSMVEAIGSPLPLDGAYCTVVEREQLVQLCNWLKMSIR